MRTTSRVSALPALLGVVLLLAQALGAALAPGPAAAQSVDGKTVADLGFRPDKNGFSFENYGPPPQTDLTAADLRRMFGDAVCVDTAGGDCKLSPAGADWMKQMNKAMRGGHCEGMAALSLLLHSGRASAGAFGGGASAVDLKLGGNVALQREIAVWWSTQATLPTAGAEMRITPNEVVDLLVDSFTSKSELFSMGIYKRGTPSAGHAITPYAVVDQGGGKVAIMVYDNNWPKQPRAVQVDRNANTWHYSAATNPSEPEGLYEGDAGTKSLTLTPTSVRLQPQACPFCDKVGTQSGGKEVKGNAAATPAQEYDEIWLEGDGHLMLTDAQGRRTGLVGGQLLLEIPGVVVDQQKAATTWTDDEDPFFFVPSGTGTTITIDGTGLKKPGVADVTVVGPGHALAVEEIHLAPGQKDTFIADTVKGRLTYTTQAEESPTLTLDVNTATADYGFVAKGADLKGGGTITLALDTAKGQLGITLSGSKAPANFDVEMEVEDDDSDDFFSHSGVILAPGDTAYLVYGGWKPGSGIPFAIDRLTDGTIDQTTVLSSEGGGATLRGAPTAGSLGPGKSVTFEFDYPGDEAVYTINAQVSPDNGAYLRNVGLEVRRPRGQLQVKGGAQPGNTPNVSVDVIQVEAGTYAVKLFNDNPNVTINYTVSVGPAAD
jgi:hypothetical protein